MISKYDTYLNEAKVSEMTVGVKVLFKGKYNIGAYGYNNLNLDGKTGTLMSAKKEYYRTDYLFKLDEPIIKNEENKWFFHPYGQIKSSSINTVKLNSLQLRNVIIRNPENDERIKKIEAKEIFPFKASKILLFILKQMKFKLGNDHFDASFFDIVKDDNSSISFIPSKKIGEDSEKFRTVSKVGRVLKKLNPNLNESEIEQFVDLYRAEYANYFKESNVEVVTGDKIPYWYLMTRYAKGGSTLNSSCMRGSGAQNQLKFYAKFPDRIAMAIIVKEGKLYARAIIWKLDDDRVYMDRIYSVSGQYTNQMKKFAAQHNMIIRGTAGLGKKKVTLPKYMGNTPYFDSFYKTLIGDKTVLESY